MNQFIEIAQEKHKIQQVIDGKLREIIVEYLQPRSGKIIRYKVLCDELKKQLEIPKELESDFRADFERVTEQMNFERILLKSWMAKIGSHVFYPRNGVI